MLRNGARDVQISRKKLLRWPLIYCLNKGHLAHATPDAQPYDGPTPLSATLSSPDPASPCDDPTTRRNLPSVFPSAHLHPKYLKMKEIEITIFHKTRDW